MTSKQLAKPMGVGYRQYEAIGMVVEPRRASLSSGKEMPVVTKGAATAIGNRPVRDDQGDDTRCWGKRGDTFRRHRQRDRLSSNWTVGNHLGRLAKQRRI